MDKFDQLVENEQWKSSVKGFNEDEGYAERYYNHTHGENFWLKQFLSASFGLFLIVLVTIGFMTGWFKEVFLLATGVAFIWFFVWAWMKFKNMRRQDRLHNEAFERQRGVDGRFGRLGADRKKK